MTGGREEKERQRAEETEQNQKITVKSKPGSVRERILVRNCAVPVADEAGVDSLPWKANVKLIILQVKKKKKSDGNKEFTEM